MLVVGGTWLGSYTLSDVWALTLDGSGTWSRVKTLGTPPSARAGHTAIYDPVRDRVLVFGGYVSGLYGNDVWSLSLTGPPTWSQLSPSGAPPLGRASHTAIYDPGQDRMIVFGGVYQTGNPTYAKVWLGDVWALTLGGSTAWTELSPSGVPPHARSDHTALYDAAGNRMLLHGGYFYDGFASSLYGDVWALTLGATPAWTALSPIGTPPEGRYEHSAVLDPTIARMVVLGGQRASSGLGSDLWALSLTGTPQWIPMGAGPFGALGDQTAIVDSEHARMVVFGGHDGSYSALDAAWELDLDQGGWYQDAAPLLPPFNAAYPAAVYDPTRDRMLVMEDGTVDTWALDLAGYEWTHVVPGGGPPPPYPPPRHDFAAVYDPVRSRILVFGGWTTLNVQYQTVGDVWALQLTDPPQWTQVASSMPGVARFSPVAFYDPVRDRLVVGGGQGIYGQLLNDIWALPLGNAGGWAPVATTGSPPTRFGPSAYDPARDRLVVFREGGSSPDSTWALSLSGTPAWSLLWSALGGLPKNDSKAIYDPIRDRIVAYGGSSGLSGAASEAEAFALDGAPEWALLSPALPPGTYSPSRKKHVAAYDPIRDQMVVFGGRDWETNPLLNDTWLLTWGESVLSVACPGDVTWTLGATADVSYQLTNPSPAPHTFDLVLDSGRAWPGLPLRDTLTVGTGTTTYSFHVPVPDTAAVGLDLMTFRAGLHLVPGTLATCTNHLHDDATATLLSLAEARAEPDLVKLRWYVTDGRVSSVALYRRTPATDWMELARLRPDGTGLLAYEDRDVSRGARYGYRLGIGEGANETYLAEIWVDVPRAPEFALAGLHPNPAIDDLFVAFSLPDGAAARLEIFDVSGRRILGKDVGVLGAGNHVVNLSAGRVVPAGIYVIRLARGQRALTARAAVLN